MLSANEDLLNCIKTIRDKLVSEVYFNFKNAMESSGSWTHHYNSLAELYSKGVDSCDQFFISKNIIELTSDFNDLGLYEELMQIKEYVNNPQALEIIKEIEDELKDYF